MQTHDDLSTLNALARVLSHTADLEQSLGAALDTVAELLHLETGWVWLLDAGADNPRLGAARNLPPGLAAHPELMRGRCFCLDTYQAGDLQGATNINVVWCSRLTKLVEGTNGLQCHATVPLYADDRRLGVLNVASRDWRELSEHELQLLYTVGALLSLAIERSRLAARSAQVAALEERNRLAREIHDTLAQSLTAIVLQLETADAHAESDGEGVLASQIRRSLALARTTLDEARRSVLDLRDAPLDGRSLGTALLDLAREIRASHPAGPIVRVDVEDDSPLPPAVEIGVYRIVCEALTNARRHSRATAVAVTLSRPPATVRITIVDDGVGFDPATVPPGRFGLVGMRERAHLLGGSLTVESHADAGTAVELSVPVRVRDR